MNKKIKIAIVGLGFEAEFIPIYQKHPNAEMYAICQRNKSKMDEIGDAYGIDKRYLVFWRSTHIRRRNYQITRFYA